MKKLMIAAAIVCAAAMSQAATVKWQVKLSTTPSVVKINDKNGAVWTVSGTANTAQTAYLVLAADTASFVEKLNAGTLSASDYLDSTTTFAAATGVMSSLKETPNNTKITTDAQAFNVVLVYTDGNDKDWYQVSSTTASSDARQSDGDPAQAVFQTGSTFANSTTGWTQVGGAAPEPTSGLLLLLGVAGLALKRKRA